MLTILVDPDGVPTEVSDVLEWLYFKTDWAVYKLGRSGYPGWFVTCYSYLIGQHVFSYLHCRPWRDFF